MLKFVFIAFAGLLAAMPAAAQNQGNPTYQTITTVGNATVGGALGVTGSATFSGGLTGTLTGHASLDLPLTGGTISGSLTTSGNTTVPAVVVGGTQPTLSGTCSTGTKVGGATAGSFKFSAACSAGTVILSFAVTIPSTGWACIAQDMTTPADTVKQTAYTTSTATFTATAASGDQVVYSCEGF
ncbi:MAG: hypothetical protein P4L71_00390 [Acetobacteraceae bacterium]|nr:hypothetical protein [Acetobacteraceae bacterium]